MRILDWECQISPDGTVRAASHPENGSVCWLNGRLVGNCDAPPAVFEWLIRTQLRAAYDLGAMYHGQSSKNPYTGEPPNKDNEPS